MKTFVIGDIHGGHRTLLQCIDRSNIDKLNDTLIVIGDVVDGWPDVSLCVDTLLEFTNLIIVRGNHDQWFIDFVERGIKNFSWLSQGGQATLDSYKNNPELILDHYNKFFSKSKIYFIDNERNYAFVHGGYNWHKPLSENDPDDIMWDRHMLETAHMWHKVNTIHGENNTFKEFAKIFIGHTTTEHTFSKKILGSTDPSFISNVINLDTGGGFSGKLTIMNIDTLDYWQSDVATELYKDYKRR